MNDGTTQTVAQTDGRNMYNGRLKLRFGTLVLMDRSREKCIQTAAIKLVPLTSRVFYSDRFGSLVLFIICNLYSLIAVLS